LTDTQLNEIDAGSFGVLAEPVCRCQHGPFFADVDAEFGGISIEGQIHPSDFVSI
jgi:hypothetical protein